MAKSANYNWTTYEDGVTVINFQDDISGFIHDVDTKFKQQADNIESVKAIAESGTNPNGSYIRFDDGTQICYGRFYRELNVAQPIAGMYRASSGVTVPDPPASFVGKPLRLFNPINDTTGTDAIVFAILEQVWSFRVDIFTPVAHSLLNINIGYLYVGRWK